jgi:hypothetical protein
MLRRPTRPTVLFGKFDCWQLIRPGFHRKKKIVGIRTAAVCSFTDDRAKAGTTVIVAIGQYNVGTPAERSPTQASSPNDNPRMTAS